MITFYFIPGYDFGLESTATVEAEILATHRIVESFKFAYAGRSFLGDEDYIDIKEVCIVLEFCLQPPTRPQRFGPMPHSLMLSLNMQSFRPNFPQELFLRILPKQFYCILQLLGAFHNALERNDKAHQHQLKKIKSNIKYLSLSNF